MTRTRRRLPLLLAFLGVFFLVAVLALAIALGRESQESPTVSGIELYTSLCAGCHGLDGAGNSAIPAPALNAAGQTWRLSDSEILAITQQGHGAMPAAAAQLSPAEVQAVIEVIRSWWTPDQRAQQP